MLTFLQLVAKDLYQKFGNDFSRTVIVFPNKRAGLFMNEHLLSLTEGAPLWAPQYITISDLFRSFLPLIGINDPVDTVLRIVMLYRRLTGHKVSVDMFYGWAERLLADFDDVDKNLADPDELFRNVSEWKQYDDLSFLNAEQIEELRRFFADFDPERKSDLREKYRRLWDVLGQLYHALNDSLSAEGVAYEGALYRKVVEQLLSGQQKSPDDCCYVFVGFNVLDRAEQELFKFLKREGKALFYWDYDKYYLEGEYAQYNEAGTFIRENLLMFPNELKGDCFDNFSSDKKIEMISASTEAIQAQFVAPWLEQHLTQDEKQTAVVLCNENLLQPVLHALPESIGELNVTKGFPLSHTEVVTAVERMFAQWERQKCSKSLQEVLRELAEYVEAEGRAYVEREDYDEQKFEHILQGEAYYQMLTILNRYIRIFDQLQGRADFSDLDISLVTLRRLVRQVVRQSSVPFHGEPAVGLQVMGVLETRCLDFEHIIMLSVNDGMLPQKANDNSFIPFVLRKAFHLTTPDRRTAVYAYYFYRLLQRAQHVSMTYNTSTDGMSTGEMSRFMTQLLVEWPGRVEHFTLNSVQHTEIGVPQSVEKPADLVQRLTKEGEKYPSISPSALKDYLQCQLLFFYKSVMMLKEPDEPTEDMKFNTFGTIFHKAAEMVYQEIMDHHGAEASPEYLRKLADDKKALAAYVAAAFEAEEVEYRILEGRVLAMYLSTLLKRDADGGKFRVVDTELSARCYVDVKHGADDVTFCIKGFIDRLDYFPDRHQLRLLDYKTGGASLDASGRTKESQTSAVADFFEEGTTKGNMLQTFLYGMMLLRSMRRDERLQPYATASISPALFYLRCAAASNYDPRLSIEKHPVDDLQTFMPEFTERLQTLISDIINPDTVFRPTDDDKHCANCAYKHLCHGPK